MGSGKRGHQGTKTMLLAQTPAYVVEYQDGEFSISRVSDAHVKATTGEDIVERFRQCIINQGTDAAIAVYLRAMSGVEWKPLYSAQSSAEQGNSDASLELALGLERLLAGARAAA